MDTLVDDSAGAAQPLPDIYTEKSLNRIHELNAWLREHRPVQKITVPPGIDMWVVTRYADARQALADTRLRSQKRDLRSVVEPHIVSEQARAVLLENLGANLLNSDPPEHTRLRSVVGRAFTPRRVEGMRDRIEAISRELIDGFADGGPVDLIEQYALRLPVFVICELLGVPAEDRDRFGGWSNALLEASDPDATAEAGANLFRFLGELIAAKRAQPSDDLLSVIVAVADDPDGGRLDEAELVSMALLLLIAGNESTVNLIGNGMLALLENPDEAQRLREDPQRVPAAIEEFLRYDGPINHTTFRWTAEPVEFGDVTVPAGELLVISLSAANRDPRRFPDPDRLDVDRDDVAHLGFGHGPHFCLGSALARMEGEIAVRDLLARFSDIRADRPTDALTYRFSPVIHGLRELPVQLTPAVEAVPGD